MPCSRRHCCLRKNVSSQVMRSSSASTLAQRSARPRSCASTPSRSRFNAAVGDVMDFMSDCEVGTRELAQEDAAMATESVEDWPRVCKNSCSDTPRDRGAHVCCRVSVSALVPVPASASGVFSSGLFLYFKSFKSLESLKSKPSEITAGILVFSF